MPPPRPALELLISRITGDISSRTEGRAFLKRSVEKVFGFAIAGVAHSVYGFLESVAAELFPDTASIDGLLRWGAQRNVLRKGGSYAGGGSALCTGTNGTVIAPGTRFRAASDAIVMTQSAVTVAAGTATVALIAELPGEAGNLLEDEELTIVTSIAGLDDEATVTVSLTGGLDLELVEPYRDRVLDDLRSKHRNGAPGDYRAWALAREGVTRAWEYPHRMGLGTVAVGFVFDDRDDPIPVPGDVAAMQAWLDELKPLDMRAVYAVAPIAKPVDITLALVPATVAVDDAVRAELAGLFRDAELEEALALSVVDEAISSAAGESSHTISSISSLVPGTWEILTLGTVTTGI